MQLTRREFHRLAALTALAPALPATGFGQDSGVSSGRKFRWGIVALGRISMGHFMPGVKQSNTGVITALVSGHRDKAEKQAALYGVSSRNIYSYENFDSIRDNKDVDGVYIALPNSMHAEFTIRAAKAGKHVLCEKPMATSIADAQAMIDACQANNVRLMIAYRCQYQPLHLKAIEMIRSGSIGQVQAIESAFGFNIKPGEWRLNRKLAGGGPMMDVGIYSLNACRYLTGEEPAHIHANSSVIDHDGRFNEVEENVGWTMKFPSGIVASCNTTYGASMNGYFRVHGAKGAIEISPAFNYDGVHLKAELPNHQVVELNDTQHDPDQFTTQADYFANCVWNHQEPKTDGQEGLRDLRYISEIYKDAGLPPL